MSDAITLRLNPDDLTLGDLEDFEEYTGQNIDEVVKPVPVVNADGNRVFDAKGRPEMTVKVSTKAVVCLVWLIHRRTDPSFSITDARNVKVSALMVDNSGSSDLGNE